MGIAHLCLTTGMCKVKSLTQLCIYTFLIKYRYTDCENAKSSNGTRVLSNVCKVHLTFAYKCMSKSKGDTRLGQAAESRFL